MTKVVTKITVETILDDGVVIDEEDLRTQKDEVIQLISRETDDNSTIKVMVTKGDRKSVV